MIPIYISHATPHTLQQQYFLQAVKDFFAQYDMVCGNIYVSDTDYLMDVIKEKIKGCYGIVIVAYERKYIQSAVNKNGANIPGVVSEKLNGVSETTPFIHIETAMAMAYDLPVILFKEKGLFSEGVLLSSYHEIISMDFDMNDRHFFTKEATRNAVSSFRKMVNAKMAQA